MAYGIDDAAPLLPASVKAWLQGWLFRVLGFVVLLGCAATGASLLTWTAIDPILARATGSAARNLLGAPGAIVSDVLMQMTGLAGIFVVLPPAFWALQLLTTGRPPGAIRFKVALAPLAVLCMAVALSSLPVLRGSPLHHGYGGLLGDTGLVFIASFLAKVNPDRSWAAAGLFCFAGGTFALMRSAGLTQQDLKAICQTAPRVRLPRRWQRQITQWRRREPILTASPRGQDPLLREPPRFEAPLRDAIDDAPLPRLRTPPREPDLDFTDSGRGSAFDHFTDRSSEDIARRFAPGGGFAVEPGLSPVADEPPAASVPSQISPSLRHIDATWVRSSLGPLKRRQPVKGITRPEQQREKVHLCDLLECDAFRTSDATLPIALGRDSSGDPVIADVARLPNLLLAAADHAEKMGGINAVVLSLVHRHAPEQCRLMMITSGGADPSVYDGMPHLISPVVTDPRNGIAALDWIVAEMDERFRRMAQLGLSNIDVFNNRVGRAAGLDPLPHIVVVADELSDLMSVGRHKVEALLRRLEKKARAAGIHLVLATQRPAADVLTAAIKRTFPTRLCFRVGSRIDSCAVLDTPGAELLRGEGEMLYWSGNDRSVRLQGPVVSDAELSAMVACLRDRAEPRYV
jgi:S-DNA-T family DNA segregation ATPase FtsK/SpoIIIE